MLFQRDAVRYFSTLVVLELYAGAFSPRDRRALRGIVASFARAGRMLVPSGTVWEDARYVLRALQTSRGSVGAGYPSLVNDVLIALSARAIAPSSRRATSETLLRFAESDRSSSRSSRADDDTMLVRGG